MLVRGHQVSNNGFVVNYRNLCYTAHSKPRAGTGNFKGAIGKLVRNGKGLKIKEKYITCHSTDVEETKILIKCMGLWENTAKSEPSNWNGACQTCDNQAKFIGELACQERILVTHTQSADPVNSVKLSAKIPNYIEYLLDGSETKFIKLPRTRAESKLFHKFDKDIPKDIKENKFKYYPQISIDSLPLLNPDLKIKGRTKGFTQDSDDTSGESNTDSDNKDMSEEDETSVGAKESTENSNDSNKVAMVKKSYKDKINNQSLFCLINIYVFNQQPFNVNCHKL
uniref:Peptidyl-prolyl cis-trans isomerase CWC27 like protein n=1 Tax=Rhabditophanes sp. KR3021 TaxID=114890 RepID=A0AC35TSC4_9BILA